MLRIIFSVISLAVLVSCAHAPQLSPAVRSDLAPSGKLRAGINYAGLLGARDPASGELRGVAVDLARELGRRIGVPVDLVGYDSVGRMAEGAKSGAWDVAFLAAEPARAGDMIFTPAYMEVEATYLVPAGSPLRTVADVDRDGVRVAVNANSGYDLYLTRTLQRARLVRAPTINSAFDLFVTSKLEALAGLKPRLVADAEKLPGSRVLEGRYMAAQQTIATPRGRDAGAKYLREFIEDAKASGFVAGTIEKHGVRGVALAPGSPHQ